MNESSIDLRERLLQAAIRGIRERGVHAFSLRATARDVGVDPAMVYREFKDKAALVEAVALSAFARLAHRSHEAIVQAGSDPEARLRALGRSYVQFALANPTEFEVMFTGGRRAAIPGDIPSAYDQLESVLRELADCGRLGVSVPSGALHLWAAVHGLAWLLLDGGLDGYPESEPDVALEQLLDQLMAAVLL